MHVSKQKDRLPYHSIFYPDYLVFYSSESSATNSLSQSPLTNVFPINATQTGSLMNFGSQPFWNSMFRGLVRGARKGSTPDSEERGQIRGRQPKQYDHKTHKWSAKGGHTGQGLVSWQQQARLTTQRHSQLNAP